MKEHTPPNVTSIDRTWYEQYLVRTVGNVCAMYDSFSWNENDDPALGNVNIERIYRCVVCMYVWFSIGVRGSVALPNECVPSTGASDENVRKTWKGFNQSINESIIYIHI